jgi:hypothetical protein
MADVSLSACLVEIKNNAGRHYVYVLERPNGDPFYVGMAEAKSGGTQRISQHFYDAKKCIRLHRHNIIRKAVVDGTAIGVKIHGWYSTRLHAAEREIELIKEFGRIKDGGLLVNKTAGGEGVKNLDADSRRKISEAITKRNVKLFSNPVWRAAHRESVTKGKSDPAYRARASKTQQEISLKDENRKLFKKRIDDWGRENPELLAVTKAQRAASMRTEAKRALASKSTKLRFSDPLQRAAQSERTKQFLSDPIEKQKRLMALKQAFDRPEYREKRRALSKSQMADPVMRKMLSDAAVQQWSNPEARRIASERAIASARVRRQLSEKCRAIMNASGIKYELPSLTASLAAWLVAEATLIRLSEQCPI